MRVEFASGYLRVGGRVTSFSNRRSRGRRRADAVRLVYPLGSAQVHSNPFHYHSPSFIQRINTIAIVITDIIYAIIYVILFCIILLLFTSFYHTTIISSITMHNILLYIYI